MKNPVLLMSISMILGLVLANCNTSGAPQDDRDPDNTAYVPGLSGNGGTIFVPRGMEPVQADNGDSINALANALKDANDNEKEELESKIKSVLEKQYDGFLAQNEEQIEQLQKRIDKLKEQLDRRRDAKSKMVKLQFERVVNESEGLVWPQQGRGSAFRFPGEPKSRGPGDPFGSSTRMIRDRKDEREPPRSRRSPIR